MFVFNTTFLVQPSVFQSWIDWLHNSYCGCISKDLSISGYEIFEVMTIQEDGSHTVSVQWRCQDVSLVDKLQVASDIYCRLMGSKFGERCLAFSSVLKKLQ